MSSDEDSNPRRRRGKRVVKKNLGEAEDDFLRRKDDKKKKKTSSDSEDEQTKTKKPRRRKARSKSPSKKSKKDYDNDDNDDEKKGKKKGKKDKKKKDVEEEDSGSDIEKDSKGQKKRGGLFGKLGKKPRESAASDNDTDGENAGDGEGGTKRSGEKKSGKKEKKSSKPEDSGSDSNDEKPENNNNSDDDDDDDNDEGTSKRPREDKRTMKIGKLSIPIPKFLPTSEGLNPFNKTIPRPLFYKNAMKNWTLANGYGLGHLTTLPQEVAEKPIPKNYCGTEPSDVISFLVGAMENLVDDPCVVHPMVRIHVVDMTTGKYLERIKRKGIKSDPVSNYHEKQTVFPVSQAGKRQSGKKLPYIPPVCTLPFKMNGSRGVNPSWREQLILMENYTTILSPKALILFEILDFGPTVPLKDARGGGGFYRIAWAFLKPIGAHNHLNVGVRKLPSKQRALEKMEVGGEYEDLDKSQKVCRLQLYKYQKDTSLIKSQAMYRGLAAFAPPPLTPEVPTVFLQFLRQKKIPYASTITVVVGPVVKPKQQVVLRRPAAAWEKERHRLKFTEMESKAAEMDMEGGGRGGRGGGGGGGGSRPRGS